MKHLFKRQLWNFLNWQTAIIIYWNLIRSRCCWKRSCGRCCCRCGSWSMWCKMVGARWKIQSCYRSCSWGVAEDINKALENSERIFAYSEGTPWANVINKVNLLRLMSSKILVACQSMEYHISEFLSIVDRLCDLCENLEEHKTVAFLLNIVR